jgi:broad-specificity NMP kinase
MRSKPNVIITGTPGVGKTTHCESIAQATGLKHLAINQIVKDRGCHEGWDEEYQSWIVDEDKVRSFPSVSGFAIDKLRSYLMLLKMRYKKAAS